MTSNLTQGIWKEYFQLNSDYLQKESLLRALKEEIDALTLQIKQLQNSKAEIKNNIKEKAILLKKLRGGDVNSTIKLNEDSNHSNALQMQLEQLKRYSLSVAGMKSERDKMINNLNIMVATSRSNLEEQKKFRICPEKFDDQMNCDPDSLMENREVNHSTTPSIFVNIDEDIKFLESKGACVSEMNIEQLNTCISEMEGLVEILNGCVASHLCGNCIEHDGE